MRNYYRDSVVKVNVDNLLYNINTIKEQCSKNKFLFAVIKGNGYGHGLVEMAHIAKKSDADGIAVATTDEAVAIRNHMKGIKILNLGITRNEDYQFAAKNYITTTVANMESVDYLEDLKLEGILKVHLKVNSGMNRIGFYNLEQIKEALKKLSKNDHIMVEGIFTHFATAEDYDKEDYLWQQYQKFEEIVIQANHDFKYIHCANSASLLKFSDKFTITNANRLGIAMYNGLQDKVVEKYELKPTFELVTKITQVNNQYPANTKIGYSNRYATKENYECIATLPIGYADGLHRHLTKAKVYSGDKQGTIVGSICMDQMMVKFEREVKPGDEVTIIGLDKETDVYARAAYLETITHEIMTSITSRVPRLYYLEGKLVDVANDLLKV